jgi:hypothetical protein
MTENNKPSKAPNAWIAIDHGLAADLTLAPYTLLLKGERSLYQAIADDDWVLILNTAGHITRVGRVLRVRSDLETTTIYFDRMLLVDPAVSIGLTSLTPPSTGSVGRIQWTDFLESLPKALDKTIAEVPTIEDQAYIRELLQLAVMDDLLGPAGGPRERIVDMGVRDRYLVGKLAPREAAQGGIEGLDGPLANDDAEEPTEAKAPGRHEPGAEFGTATGRVEPESDSSDEIDAASNQSLVPSSLGMTFCVDGDADRSRSKHAGVGTSAVTSTRYSAPERIRKPGRSADQGQGLATHSLWRQARAAADRRRDPHQAPDNEFPEVRVQGSIRAKNANGDRLVTLFLVNAQEEPDTNRDTAWVFQPELIVRSEKDAAKRAIFRRRPVLDADGMDPEREALEMIYRNRVEFAVGHGVAVHAETADDVTLATEVRTT